MTGMGGKFYLASAIDANIVFGIYILAQACIPVCCRKAFAGGGRQGRHLKAGKLPHTIQSRNPGKIYWRLSLTGNVQAAQKQTSR